MNRRRRISVRPPLPFLPFHEGVCSCDSLLVVWLNSIVRDFLDEILQISTNRRLDRTALLMCTLVPQMEQNPEFKTRIRNGEIQSVVQRLSPGLRQIWVVVDVKYAPDFVVFEVRVAILSRFLVCASLPFDRLFNETLRNTAFWHYFHLYELASVLVLEGFEIRRLRNLALTKHQQPLPGLLLGGNHASGVCCDAFPSIVLVLGDETGFKKRDSPVATLQVSPLEVFVLTRFKVAKRIEVSCAAGILLGEPDLISPQQGVVQ